jgi:alpha-aminoadipic semialdehyde synthase
MIDTLWAFAQRLRSDGIAGLLADTRRAHEYESVEEAHAHIAALGQQIRQDGVPRALRPLVCGITGYGNVSQGAQEILDLLPVETVTPETLARQFDRMTEVPDRIFKVVFKEEHLVETLDPESSFNLQDYYDHPERYRPRFENYLPYLTMLINCIYWEPKYPRLVTRAYLERAWAEREPPRLSTIGDISCDVEGSIECTVKATDPGDPIYVYEPSYASIRAGCEGAGPVIMAVDNLPCELPKDASEEFSRALLPFVPALAHARYDLSFHELALPMEFVRAMILHRGELTPDYRFMQKFLA